MASSSSSAKGSSSSGTPPLVAMIPPSMTWMTVFFPALAYFVVTRLSGSGGSFSRFAMLGEVVATNIQLFTTTTSFHDKTLLCDKISSIFYVSSCKTSENSAILSRTLNLVQSTGLDNVQASCWRHDSEMGRGYLLLSQSAGKGRVWRWEVGGGPIPIGKTLHLEASGCRSNRWKNCDDGTIAAAVVGSGGIAMDFINHDHYSAGRLVVAEWGEGRISRIEENGARTPLIIGVPNICSNETVTTTTSTTSEERQQQQQRRLQAPTTLLYTPFGDLLVADVNPECQRAALFRLRQAVHVPPLPSLSESRQAHNWTSVHHHQPLDVIFIHDQVKRIGGFALDASWTGIYVTVEQDDDVLLYHYSLSGDDDDVEEEDLEPATEVKPKLQWKIVLNVTEHLTERKAGSIVLDNGGNIFLSIANGVAMVQASTGEIVGTLDVGARPRSLTLGEDGYLYVVLESQLLRVPIKTRPLKIPTNLVVPIKKSKTTTTASQY